MLSEGSNSFALKLAAVFIGCFLSVELFAADKNAYINEVLALYQAEEKWTNLVTTFVENKREALENPALYEDELDSWLEGELAWATNERLICNELQAYSTEQLSGMVNSLKSQGVPDGRRGDYLSTLVRIGNSAYQAAIRPRLDELMMMEAEHQASMSPVSIANSDGSVTTQVGSYSSVTNGDKYISFDFDSPPLPAIDLMAFCAGDISRFEPLFALLQQYAGYIENYTFAEGAEGPLCKEESYSALNGGRLYRIVLSQFIGHYELREIRVSVARTRSEVRTLSISGLLFLSEVAEHQPENWISVDESHRLAIEALISSTPGAEHARYKALPIPSPKHYAASGFGGSNGASFIPMYELWTDDAFVYVDRLTGEATVDFPKVIH